MLPRAGKALEGPGSFLSPTLIAIENPKSRYVQDELFGTIITLETFDSEE